MDKEDVKKSFLDNVTMPIVKEILFFIIGSVITLGLSYFGFSYYEKERYHDIISFDSISTIIDTYLVKTDLLNSSILEYESPQEQIEIIGDLLAEQETLISGLRSLLISAGYDEEQVNSLDTDGLLAMFSDYSQRLTEEEAKNMELARDYQTLEAEYATLNSKPMAELLTPSLIVQGESIDTTLKNCVTVVDGKNYYHETLLNSYILDEQISMRDGILMELQLLKE